MMVMGPSSVSALLSYLVFLSEEFSNAARFMALIERHDTYRPELRATVTIREDNKNNLKL
jgi:hypothetical protein